MRERERENTCVCVCIHIHILYIYIHTYTYIYTHTHERGLTCVHHVVVLQKKNDLLIEYVKKAVSAAVRLDSLDQ